MSDEPSKYPEHDKLMAVKDESQTIGEFLDIGLGQQGLRVCEADKNGRFWPSSKPIEKMLAEYFDIDRDALEDEKRAMLEEQRLHNVQQRRLEGFKAEGRV